MSKKTLAIVVSLVIVSLSFIALLVSLNNKKVTASTADSGIDPAQSAGGTKIESKSLQIDLEALSSDPTKMPENEARILDELLSDPKNKGKVVGMVKGDDGLYHLDRLMDRPDKSAEEYYTNGEKIIVNGNTFNLKKLTPENDKTQ